MNGAVFDGTVFDGTVFVGREDELAELAALLTHARLVTVTGTGGVGKTRLALEAARQARPRFADGAYVAALSSLTDPALLPNTVITALGLSGPDSSSALDTVLDYLRPRKVLLILDTCEHLLDCCATLAETLLQEAPGVTVLATSRQPLDIAGEMACPLAPLRVPAPGDPAGPGDAVDLFTRLARAALPGFTLASGENGGAGEDGTVADAVELCRRLGGIPLAIELAAARLRTRPLAELVRQVPLDAARAPDGALPCGAPNSGASYSGGRRPAEERHRTMEAAIAWSYRLCTPAERALWERLSVFAGTFDIRAAERVCADEDLPAGDVLTAVVSLVDKSVLTREDCGTSEEAARYRMLDTIRDFGAWRLDASGARDSVRRRLIARCLAKAQSFGRHLLDEEQLPRFRALRAEHDTIRAALGHALAGLVPPEECASLVAALSWYWHVGGQYQEGLHWIGRVLALFPETGSPGTSTPGTGPGGDPGIALQRAITLTVRCALGATGGQPEQAAADGHEAIRLARRAGMEPLADQVHLYLTNALFLAGDYDTALETAEVARRSLEVTGDLVGLVTLGLYLTNLHQLRGDFAESDAWYQRTAGLLSTAEDRWLSGWLHLMGGYTLFWLGEDARCAGALRASIAAKHDLGDLAGLAFGLEALGALHMRADRHERGAWLMGAAASLWDRAVSRLAGNAVMRAVSDEFVASARQSLGADRFGEILARGGQAPVDQAVFFALSDSDDLPGPHDGPAFRVGDHSVLTGREREIALLAGAGLSNREIAEQLVVSKRTVDSHMVNIYAKLGLSSRAELGRWRHLAR